MFTSKNPILLVLPLTVVLAGGRLCAGTDTNPPAALETETANTAPDGQLRMPPLETAASPAAHATNRFTVFMIGDSTMANKPVIPEYPERGWGQMLPQYFQSGVRIENHAMNGRSSKSFIDEGRWAVVTNRLQPGDWVIIQFGHNDEKGKGPKRFTEPFGRFETNLVKFITEARAHGARPVLCTAIARRKFDAGGNVVDTHGDYIQAARDVAAAQNVPLLDLNRRTDELLRRLGPDRSQVFYDWFTTNDFPGLKKPLADDTHLNATGASRVCDFAVEEIKANAPELARYLNTAK
jgi:lysophospholipase L1-like esterase